MHQPPIPHVASEDPEVAGLIDSEAERQFAKIRLIPSENYVSAAVLEASGTVLTNKYSEGYPGRRYYEGQQFIDPIETLAIAAVMPLAAGLYLLTTTAWAAAERALLAPRIRRHVRARSRSA